MLFISFERLANSGIVSVAAMLKEVCDALSAGGTRIPNQFRGSDIRGLESLSVEVFLKSSSTMAFSVSRCLLTG